MRYIPDFMHRIIGFILFSPLFFACQPAEKTDLHKAQDIHRQIMALESRLQKAYAKLDTPEAAQQQWYEQFRAWQNSLVSVPGLAHEHTDDAHHHHQHTHEKPQLTDTQLLEVQKVLLRKGEKLKTDWKAVK